MRVGFDVSIQSALHPTGVERSQATLLSALLASDADHELHLMTPGEVPAAFRDDPRVHVREGSQLPIAVWREVALPPQLREARVELFHSPVAAIPLRTRCPRLATLHEVPWARPAGRLGDRSLVHRLRADLALRFAARLVCPSQATARDVIALRPAAESRVRVLCPAVDPALASTAERSTRDGVLSAVGAPDGPFVLAVGRLRRKKNLALLLEAVARRRARDDALGVVLVGPDGDGTRALVDRARDADLRGAVTFAGFVPDDVLAGLYRHCAALVFPSLFEGFGLPVVEAMSCGAPVLASAQGAVAEAAGEAVLAFDGTDVDALVAALAQVLDDADRRRRLISAGGAHAARHGVADLARRALEMYAELEPGDGRS